MMRNEFPIKAVHRGLHIVAGSFAGNVASNPTASLNTGVGFSVTRTGAGTFRIQLGSAPSTPAGLLPSTDKNVAVVAALFQVQDSAAGDHTVVLKAATASTGVFDIACSIAGTPTNLPVTARVHFALFLSDSNVLPARG